MEEIFVYEEKSLVGLTPELMLKAQSFKIQAIDLSVMSSIPKTLNK
jgi:hypothetical protein